MRRTRYITAVVATLCAVLAFASVSGCAPALDQKTVASAMARNSTDRQRVVRVGEKAIPMILRELRAHPDADHWLGAWYIVISMIDSKTADPDAPNLRQALCDPGELEYVRRFASTILVWYPDSKASFSALMDHATKDRSVPVRVRCIGSVGGIAAFRAAKRKNWSFDSHLVQFFSSMAQDRNIEVRLATVDAVGEVAGSALWRGDVELPWASRLLTGAKKDSARSVRKAAFTVLLRLEQTRSKPADRR